jgi:hypothetical protein
MNATAIGLGAAKNAHYFSRPVELTRHVSSDVAKHGEADDSLKLMCAAAACETLFVARASPAPKTARCCAKNTLGFNLGSCVQSRSWGGSLRPLQTSLAQKKTDFDAVPQ